MKTIDLRSDTVTLPPEEMRKAMYSAELGDDVYGEDPSVNKLQEAAAAAMGMEAGLFVPSGSMGNFVAMLSHLGRGDEALLGSDSHIYVHEQGSASTLGGIHMKALPTQEDGTMILSDIEHAVSPDDDHYARTRLVALENTINGSVIKTAYLKDFVGLAKKLGLATHLDGARVFNAAVCLDLKPADLTRGFDSVQFCFSKGLSAPAGSMLCGRKDFIKQARRWRKALGGGMRQVGVLAAACQYALDHMVERLAEDHETARALAEKIANLDGIKVNWSRAQTNMVWFDVEINGLSAGDLVHRLDKEGLKVLDAGPKTIRCVTHYGITMKDIDTAGDIMQKVVASCGRAPVAGNR